MSNSTKPMRKRAVTALGAIALIGTTGASFAGSANAATSSSASSTLAKIKQCESGGNYTIVNSSSGASGAYQFLNSTWQNLSAGKGYATAAAAPAAVQDAAALELYNMMGTSPWAASSSCWSNASTPVTASSMSTASSTANSSGTSTATRTTPASSAASSTSTRSTTPTTPSGSTSATTQQTSAAVAPSTSKQSTDNPAPTAQRQQSEVHNRAATHAKTGERHAPQRAQFKAKSDAKPAHTVKATMGKDAMGKDCDAPKPIVKHLHKAQQQPMRAAA